ncbi:hypothetical protein LMG28138_04954 [Pararobbsia alpina]|uniref:Uncharacterized protein n=1 Tax=Pararobbsia alpina TaxID=621374 RepID=A0A6S7BI45_9BURK|nr:hypothetical protein LMG28138_04954 [Pararobbsia alpina]
MGVQNVWMLMNLLLMKGNIGKPGAGPLTGERAPERAKAADCRNHRKALNWRRSTNWPNSTASSRRETKARTS